MQTDTSQADAGGEGSDDDYEKVRLGAAPTSQPLRGLWRGVAGCRKAGGPGAGGSNPVQRPGSRHRLAASGEEGPHPGPGPRP